ncbi:hypothetical protein [Lacticaseibacillus saniviri]|uniref:Uncharacterized protein n=1 Tax=Lacticaseibacillus saniviri JCM 17471 = DSM 24301 TaxID=1293598 RepID=A0A0R2MRP9_9LACO|nr:hypothetical protein [Lacticaseibacillus saniviri]KRO16262.1 hypothetical protein IV56_GL001623 [Lacticaseibacillus saniviri JCM 17471 = DSM 24301]MCG4281461.1 hypothetical protein [Lacticaseibacillus saniviri]
MADTPLTGFPEGEFAAFSTAKMSFFLPYTENTTPADLNQFFDRDIIHVTITPDKQLEIALPDSEIQLASYGQILSKFTNGKYKVIDADYYHKNFNDPIVDQNDRGIL